MGGGNDIWRGGGGGVIEGGDISAKGVGIIIPGGGEVG